MLKNKGFSHSGSVHYFRKNQQPFPAGRKRSGSECPAIPPPAAARWEILEPLNRRRG
jgi:hypothetical protein